MAVVELYHSREPSGGASPSCTFRYGLLGYATPQLAEADLLLASPTNYVDASGNQLNRTTWRLEPITPTDFRAEVTYGTKQNNEAGDWSYQFDTTATRARITQSLATVARFAPPDEIATDHGGAINVTKSGPQGVDAPAPSFAWQEVWSFDPAFITQAYVDQLEAMSPSMNDDTFRGKPAHEVLFLGARGGIDKGGLFRLTFSFKREKSIENLTVGAITGIEKAGQDYIWFEYEEQEDGDSHRIKQVPIAAHVERVVPEADFSNLGIGTGIILPT